VGHSLGSAVAVRAVRRLNRVVGLFSIEGNLTAADAYFSGLAAAFEAPEAFRDHLLARVRELAEQEDSERSEAFWHYHTSLRLAAPETLWKIARSAHVSSRRDGLGEEYRALSIPRLYYWSRESTPRETQEYIREHALHRVVFAGGHWPMVEQPQETASQIAAFFQPLFLAYEGATHP
jgi:pimeloyl-ACP methyl ester carboxylesterase